MNLEDLTDQQLEAVGKALIFLMQPSAAKPFGMATAVLALSNQVEQEGLDRIHRHEREEAESLLDPIYRYDQDGE